MGPPVRHSGVGPGFCQMLRSLQGCENQAQVPWVSVKTLKAKG